MKTVTKTQQNIFKLIRHDDITKAQDKILQILNCTNITNEVTDASHNPELPPRVLQQPLRQVPECLFDL